MKKFANYISSVFLLTCLIGIWEVTVKNFHVSNQILPAPTAIFIAFQNNSSVLMMHTWQTLLETIIGIFFAIILGFATAILLDSSSFLRKSLYPLLIISQTIPIVALAPILLLWLGFDIIPKVIIVVLFCYFPIAIATVNGFANTEKKYKTLLSSMHASYWQKLTIIKIPSSMPSFFAGIKISATYAITGAMVGEYVGAYQGLGIFLQTSANNHQITLVFAIVFIAAFLSIVLFSIVSFLERILFPWKNSQ